MTPYLIAFALPYHLLPGSRTKCGVWSALSYGLFTALFTAVTNSDPGLLWPILLGLGAVLCKDRVGEKQGMLLLPVLALSLAGLLGATHGYYESALLWLLRKLGNNNAVAGTMFGVLNTLLRPLSAAFEQPVYLHSAGGAVWLDGQILTGAKTIFAAKPGRLATALFCPAKGCNCSCCPGLHARWQTVARRTAKPHWRCSPSGVYSAAIRSFLPYFWRWKVRFCCWPLPDSPADAIWCRCCWLSTGDFCRMGNRGVSPAQQQRRTAVSCGRDILRAGLFCQPVLRNTAAFGCRKICAHWYRNWAVYKTFLPLKTTVCRCATASE